MTLLEEPFLPLVLSVRGVRIRHPHIVQWRIGARLFGYSSASPPAPRGLIIGECPGPRTDPRMPLFPNPENSTGARLLGYSNMSERDYMGLLMRTNLCPTTWYDDIAELRVEHLKRAIVRFDSSLRVLLLGAKVEAAWGIRSRYKFGEARVFVDDVPISLAWIPHPSGLNRIYNDEESQRLAGRYVRWCAGMERP